MTMIGIDPHKATHIAVAIDDDENVIDEFTLEALNSQVERLTRWADRFTKREWAVESANGLGYLISRQLVAVGETVFDVPAVLASRVRLMGSGKSQKNDPNDARSIAIAALRLRPSGNSPF
jgi:transposase